MQESLTTTRPAVDAMRFLVAWLAGPMLLRTATLLTLLPAANHWQNITLSARILALAIPQDLFIAMQALFCLSFVRFMLPRRLSRGWCVLFASLATLLYLIIHSYLLVDFVLYIKTGLRMDYSFLGFLSEAKSFASSAWAIGLGSLAVGFVALLVVGGMIYRLFRQMAESLRFSWPIAAAFPVVAVLAAASRDALPDQLGYAMDNVVLADEMKLIAHWIDGEPALSTATESEALQWLEPQGENFRRVSPNYPLLKHTDGFYGEKQFEIRIAAEERPHVVFLFLESFRAADIGVLGGKHNASPNFDRLSKQGILFKNFYGNGVQTTRGVIASLFGVLPRFSAKAVQAVDPELPLIGVADLFNRQGYASGYFFGGDLAFESQTSFFLSHGFHEMHGEDQIARAFPAAQRTSWGYHDEYLLRHLADWLAEKDRRKQPAFAAAFTISNHHPWQTPAYYDAPKFDTGANKEYGRFLQTFHYTDHCLGRFFRLLERQGLDRRTIVFVLADTATPQGEHHDNFMLVNYLYEENVHIPLLILAPGRLAKPAVIADVASQVDLLPTVMDLFGMRGLNHSIGTSLVRRVKHRAAYFNNPFAMQYLGMRQGADKYIFNVRTNASSLYRLDSDPQERRDASMSASTAAEAYRRRVTAVHQFFLKLYLTDRFVAKPSSESPEFRLRQKTVE